MGKSFALITGASTGIGRELSLIFAREGWHPILVARNKERLQTLQEEIHRTTGIESLIFAIDLSLPHAPLQLFEQVSQSIQEPLGALVNNAGFGLHGSALTSDVHTELNMIDLNVRALVYLTKLFLPSMIHAGQGKILNVASVASFLPGPLMSVYYATKAFVLSYSEALHTELKPLGLTVTVLCPGPTRTNFGRRAGLDNSRMFNGHLLPVANAHSVARAGYQGLMRGKAVVVPGVLNKLTLWGIRFLPRSVVRTIAYLIMKQR